MLVSCCCFPKSVAWRIERQSCVICGRRNGLNVLCAGDVFDIHDEFEDDVQVIEFSFFYISSGCSNDMSVYDVCNENNVKSCKLTGIYRTRKSHSMTCFAISP